LRLTSRILVALAAVVVIAGTWQFWWPGWDAAATWLTTWWWAPAAVVIATAGWLIFLASHSTAASSQNLKALEWVRIPGRGGALVAEVSETSTPRQSPAGDAAGRSNRSAAAAVLVSALVAAFAIVHTSQQISTLRDQVKIAQDGQLASRMDSAVTQINAKGSENMQSRLGGIRTLERVAGDSPREQKAVVEQLSAFIRDNLPKASRFSGLGSRSCPPPFRWESPSDDVSEALKVLGRRDRAHDYGAVIDLKGVRLAGADLYGAQLEGADLTNADLEGANLVNANLVGATLWNTRLACSYLQDADLESAHVYATSFENARLDGVNFNGTELSMSDFTNAELGSAQHNQETSFFYVSDVGVKDAWWRPGEFGDGGVY
jgi:hypothetical protein